MPEILQREYQSITDMDRVTVSGNRFYAYVAGKTNGAHQEYITRLNRIGQIEVFSPAESDYIVIFCPIASRVGTDIGEALESLQDRKPKVLVVMHHTFNPNQVVAESRRQVTDPDVRLTVDCLFHDGQFLRCTQNNNAWSEIQRTLPASQASPAYTSVCRWIMDHPWVAAVGGVLVAVGVVVIIVVSVTRE